MSDRSDDPSHHDRTLLPRSYISLPGQPTPARSYLSYFRSTKFRFHYVALTILYFSADRPNSIIEMRTQSKFHNTSNHPPPVTDSGRTVRTPLYPPVQAVPHFSPPPPPPPPFYFYSCPGQRNRRRTVPVPVTGVRYNSLL